MIGSLYIAVFLGALCVFVVIGVASAIWYSCFQNMDMGTRYGTYLQAPAVAYVPNPRPEQRSSDSDHVGFSYTTSPFSLRPHPDKYGHPHRAMPVHQPPT